MPPFTYDPYRNPYAGTIAEMLMRRGEIGARSAENIGGINARATEQRGAAWAGAAQNIGQIAAGIPLQMQKQREQALVNRERAARTANMEQGTQLDADAAVAAKQAQAALMDSLQRHRTENGVDFEAVAADLAAIDPDTAVKFQNLAKSTADVRDSIRTRNRKYASENNYDSARLAAKSPDLETFIGSVDTLVADGLMDEGNRNAVLKRAMAAGEDGWPALQQEIIKGSPEFEKEQAELADKRAQTTERGVMKPETRSIDVQAAEALAKGDTATYQRLLKVKNELADAGSTADLEMRGLTKELARERLADAQKNKPDMPPAVQRRLDVKSRAFEALPLVKTTQKMAEAVSFANSLNANTTNPADDQALIYAFAKAMDPDSVVREGEYATVQKYAQSWADSFGFNAKRIFSNTQFLTPKSRQNMKSTITVKFTAGKKQYDAVRKSYVDQINNITGQKDGEAYLTDFGSAFPTLEPGGTPPPATGKTYVLVNGNWVEQ